MNDPQDWAGPSALFLACATAGLLHPFPEDVPLLYAGMATATGASPIPILLASIAGVLVRDLILFTIGRVFGTWVLHRPLTGRILGVKRIERARHLLARHDAKAVFFNRFLVGVRSPIFVVAGAAGVTPRRFVAYDLAGLLITVPIAVFLGREFGPDFIAAVEWGLHQTRFVSLLVPGAILAFILQRSWRRRRRLAREASAAAAVADLDEEDDDDSDDVADEKAAATAEPAQNSG